MRNWPMPGGAPSASKKELAWKARLAPVSAAERISTINASAAPFAPPIGIRRPLKRSRRVGCRIAARILRPSRPG